MAAVSELIALSCSECGDRNYTTRKNRKGSAQKGTPDKLAKSKFCRRDRKHTLHKESKIK